MDWQKADDIRNRIVKILRKTSLEHIDPARVFVFRSYGSKARAYARIWSLPRIWQQALDTPPGYCIEVLSEKFDKLSFKQQTKTLIHELLHIPKTFSGSLVQHKGRGKHGVCNHSVEQVYKEYCRSK